MGVNTCKSGYPHEISIAMYNNIEATLLAVDYYSKLRLEFTS